MKKSFLSTVLACAGTAAVMAAPPPVERVLYVDFEKSNGSLSAWPRKFAASGKLLKGDAVSGVQAFAVTPNGNSGSFYFGYPSHLYNGFRTGVPGVLNLSFNVKTTSDAVKMTGAVNAGKKGKGNASNGSTAFTVPASSDKYRKFFTNVFLPDETYNAQIVLGFKGSEGSVLMDDLRVAYTPDKLVVPVSNWNGKLTLPLKDNFWNPRWKMYGFYAMTRPSSLDTAMQVAADSQGLYFAFINPDDPALLKAGEKNADAPVWNDDCNEVFLFSPAQNGGWQFAVNSNGAKSDLKLYQRVPGDPWRGDLKWNGQWSAIAVKNNDNWETRFFIPWTTLGITDSRNVDLKFNFTRQSKVIGENSSYNCGNSGFSDINNFGNLTVKDGVITIKRMRSTSRIAYTVKRSTPAEKLLKKTDNPPYISNFWASYYYPTTFGKAILNKYPRAVLDEYQEEMIRAIGESGSAGPQYPWSSKLVKGGIDSMEKYQAKYGRGMLFAMFNSDIGRAARRNGAKLLYLGNDHAVDPTDPVYVQAGVNFIESCARGKNFSRIVKNTHVLRGLDEPTNYSGHAYNRKHNTGNVEHLDKIDAEIKARYGAGKYGLPDFGGAATDKNFLCNIAFYRYWNDIYRKSMETWTAVVRKHFPGVIWHVTNANTVCAQSMLDMALCDGLGDEVSCDPYPTSTKALYGIERALYHTGYSTKIVHDLTPETRTQAILQGFVYHGGKPSVDDMREWASQAIKNGAKTVEWYISGDVLSSFFKEYTGLLNIIRQINSLKAELPLNENPVSGIWYSNFDVWARSDNATHSAYSIYSILGEALRSDFRFVSDTLARLNKARLNELKVIYVPQLSFVDKATAETLTKWVKDGGRLVIFDPEFMRLNIDGTPEKARNELIGVKWPLARRKLMQRKILWQGKVLKVTEQRNAPEYSAEYPVAAFDMSVPADARIIAVYPDGKPAAFERKAGKGSVVYFAVQPFGSSMLAAAPGAWKDFFGAEAKRAGEKINVARWDFLLPPAENIVKLSPLP